MSDQELWAAFRLWLGIAVVVVIIAAGLLITVLLLARSILHHAGRALAAGEEIRKSTLSIWALQTSNEVAESIAETVESIETKGAALVSAVSSQRTPTEPGRSS